MDALCPGGWAWTDDNTSNLAGMLYPFAALVSQAESDLEAMQPEINPGTSTLLLSDYEAVLGPDTCGRDALAVTVPQRQALAFQRWTAAAGQSIAFFTAMAAALGVEITIDEIEPAICGAAVCGVDVCSQPTDRFVWIVTLPNHETGLECPMQQLSPADTTLVFEYAENA